MNRCVSKTLIIGDTGGAAGSRSGETYQIARFAGISERFIREVSIKRYLIIGGHLHDEVKYRKNVMGQLKNVWGFYMVIMLL